MGRPSKFGADQILDAALAVLASDGLAGVTVAGIARSLGAPSGSLYHRFPRREVLLARLWLRTVRSFQEGYAEAWRGHADPLEGLSTAVRYVVTWCRAHPSEGRLLMLHRREDLVSGAWPPEVQADAHAVTGRLDELWVTIQDAAWPVPPDPAELRLAAVSIPQGAVMPYLRSGDAIPEGLEAAVVRAARAAVSSR